MTGRAAIALSALLLGAGFVAAQDRQVAPAPQQRPPAVDPKACAAGDRLQAGTPNPSAPAVICPPNIDPDIRAPTPDAGKTPIIPPPGSPGGDPSVRPK